ncbi:hypothetical protein HKBW3S34_02604, partial [Candidatus Hakubella thermalkaliphila]
NWLTPETYPAKVGMFLTHCAGTFLTHTLLPGSNSHLRFKSQPGACRRSAEVGRVEESSLLLALEPVAFTPDVEDVAGMQQPVKYSRGHNGITQNLAPLGKALVGGEDDAAVLVTRSDKGELGSSGLTVIRPHPKLIEDQESGPEADFQPLFQTVVKLRHPPVPNKLMGS